MRSGNNLAWESSVGSLPQSDQQHAANDHGGAENDARGDALDIAEKQRAEDQGEERAGAADRNHHRNLTAIKRVVDANHAETDRYAGGEKPPEASPVHLPSLLSLLDVPHRQHGHDEG